MRWRRGTKPGGSTKHVGDWAENRAVRLLRRHGYEILDRNVRLGPLEIDVVARQAGVVCFVEVRYRASLTHGHPAETVGHDKLRHLAEAAARYLARHPEYAHHPVRFDLVSVWGPRGEHAELLQDILQTN